MTVIACNHTTMAADTLWQSTNGSAFYAAKINQLEDGSIIGGAGGYHEEVMEWITRGMNQHDLPKLDPDADFDVLHLRRNGIYIFNTSLTPVKLNERNYAIGCGADVALYVMRVLKKAPAVAAREACKVLNLCGGRVDTLRLKRDARRGK